MTIKAVLMRVGQKPEIIETESSFEVLYRLIDCTIIEIIKTGRSCIIVCDEEGRWNKKLSNRLGIVGDFLIVGPIRHGDFSSISEEDMVWALNR